MTFMENGTILLCHKKIISYPVVTLVLYFGEKHWKKPLSLKECLNIPDRLEPFVNDYRINLFEISWLKEKQVQMFTSDFKIVADYFVQMRGTAIGEKIGRERGLYDAICSLMRTKKCPADQAMDMLEIPTADREKYLSKMNVK